MKPQKDWTEALRDQLKDAQVSPPADGWERLATPQPIPPLTGKETSHPSFWRSMGETTVWLAAAAAVLAAVLIINPFGNSKEDAEMSPLPMLTEASPESSPEGKDLSDHYSLITNHSPLEEATEEAVPHKQLALAKLEKHKDLEVSENAESEESSSGSNGSNSSTSTTSSTSSTSSTSTTSSTSSIDSSSSKSSSSLAATTGKSSLLHEGKGEAPSSLLAYSTSSPRGGRVTIGIRNAGSSGGTTTIRPGALAVTNGSYYYSSRPAAAPPLRASSLANNPYATIGNYVFNHNPELSLGLMAAYEPIDRLVLESGLTWSVLSSQVITPANTREQRIQYLGLPLYVGWRFIEHGSFSLTASAGATVEHLLSARLGSWKQDERPWQFAVGGQIGIRYDLGHHFGLAFEPSVNYHLTETLNTTSRTDHPLALALRLTLQYSL